MATQAETDRDNKIYRNISIGSAVVTGVGSLLAMNALKSKVYNAYKNATASPSEKAQIMAGSVKDVIKNKIMEHPKTAAAAGAASAIGAGYGAYKYLKNHKDKK
jgi:hypothetical protein